MTKNLLGTGLVSVAFLATGWIAGCAQAAAAEPALSPTPGVSIVARAVSACDQVMMTYWAPDGALVEIYRSLDGESWHRQLNEPNARFETVRRAVRYKIVVGDEEAVTENVVPYRCRVSATSPDLRGEQ